MALFAFGLALRTTRNPATRPSARRAIGLRTAPPAIAQGMQAAYDQRSAVSVVVGGALVSCVLVAVLVFGASLSTLLSTPRSYGWPWDVSTLAGYGYFGLDTEAAASVFTGDTDVDSTTIFALTNEVALDGEPVMTLVNFRGQSDLDLAVLEGDIPTADDEVAVGVATASARGFTIGDTVELAGVFDPPRPATISGFVVFPTLGPFEAERVGSGSGLLLSDGALAESSLGTQVRDIASFIGVDLRDESDTPATRERVREQLRSLDRSGFPASEYLTPVRPPEIVDAGATRTLPTLVAGVFAGVAAVGLALVASSCVHARRRELGTLRALGFSNAQLRLSIRVQLLASTVAALVVGVPAGVVVGRAAWQAFAGQLGVVPTVAGAERAAVVVIAGAIVLTLAAAFRPARLAVRTRASEQLRAE
jgi:hypothetical protein